MIDWRKSLNLQTLLLNAVGALLMLAGIGLLAMTARGLQNYHQVATRHGGEVFDLDHNAQLQSARPGSMVRIVGTPRVVEAAQDPDFNLLVSTPVLVRVVEMFQWREIRVGGGVHYELDWIGQPLDSSHFSEPAGHTNASSFPLSGQTFDAGLVQLDGFKLSKPLQNAIPGSQQVTPDIKALPANLAASFSPYKNYLVTSAHPGDPQLGDLRVSWDEVPLQQLTVVARVDGNSLVPASGASDGKGYLVQVGDVPLLDLFPDLPVPPEFVLTWRVLSVLLAALGAWLLLLARRNQRDVLLALGLGGLTVGVVAFVLWLGGDSTSTVYGWLLVAGLGLGLTIWRLQRGRPWFFRRPR